MTGVLIRGGRFGHQHWEGNHMKTDTEMGPASTLPLVWPPELGWLHFFRSKSHLTSACSHLYSVPRELV